MMKVSRTFFFILIIFFSGQSYAQTYKYLALKGGGIRGIAYAGAIKVLEERNIAQGIEKVAGTSVGAITGLLFSMGYSAKEIEDILFSIDIATFNDGEWFFIGGQKWLRKRFGWYKGEELEEWLGEKIMEKTGSEQSTFGQLHKLALTDKKFKDLYVTAVNLSKQDLEIFSWETKPDMLIKTAIRASASIPLYYGAVFIDSIGNVKERPLRGAHYDVYIDGGLMANYPLNVFNTINDNNTGRVNEYTLGLKLERPQQIVYSKDHTGRAPYNIYSFRDYLSAFYNLTIEQLNKDISYEEERKHTIYISTSNMNPRVKHITQEQKRLLFDNGKQAAQRFFADTSLNRLGDTPAKSPSATAEGPYNK